MSGNVTVRRAKTEEANALTRLCLRSKAHWGYDAAFIERSTPALTVTTAMIAAGSVLVAEDAAGIALGVAAIAATPRAGRFELSLLFVDPAALRGGVGRALFGAVTRTLRDAGAESLTILSDPFALGFYERLGAVRVGDAPSGAIPGRRLPLLEFALASDGRGG
jgi:GNAT superfamily N-acetyltransferase